MASCRLLYTTWPDAESARDAAARLVEDGLCACVNLIEGMQSVYEWEGRVETARECIALFKTREETAPALRDRILALHPYETPCVIGLPVDIPASASGFLDWIADNSRGQRDS